MRQRTTTTVAEACGIVALCFGWFIINSLYAVSVGFPLGTFSETTLLELVGFELVFASVALYVLNTRGFDVASLYPQPSLVGVATGVLVAALAFGSAWAVAAALGLDEYRQPLEALMPNNPISISVLVLLGLVNGTYEEVFLLGFLLRGLRGYGLSVAIGISILVRVLYHLYQGPLGAVYVGVFGLVLSLYYVSSGKLFPVVLAHALADIIPFVEAAATHGS